MLNLTVNFAKNCHMLFVQDVPLGAWSIKQSEGGKEVTYKFPRTVNLKSHQTLKVNGARGLHSLSLCISSDGRQNTKDGVEIDV